MNVYIRWLIRRDMPEVLQIEQASFEYPWEDEDFLRALRQNNCIGMAAEVGSQVLGYMIYELYEDHLELVNFAVHPGYRRQKQYTTRDGGPWQVGIGTAMMCRLKSKLAGHRRVKIDIAIRESNLAAQLFFRQQRFLATEVLRSYFEDTGEDAYHLEYVLPESEREPVTYEEACEGR